MKHIGEVRNYRFMTDIPAPQGRGLALFMNFKVATRVVSKRYQEAGAKVASIVVSICSVVLIDGDGIEGDVDIQLCKVQEKCIEIGALPALSGVVGRPAPLVHNAEGL